MKKKTLQNKDGVEYIEHKGQLVGLCIRKYHNWRKTKFLTPDNFFQQLGLLYYESGHKVKPHAHYKIPRTVDVTQEVLLCVSGRIIYTFYDLR